MRELVAEELNLVSGGWDNTDNPTDPNYDPVGFDPANKKPQSGQQVVDDVNEITNTFELYGGGTVTVTGPDTNNDGVVDGYADLANDQGQKHIRPGSLIDNILDWWMPQPYSDPA